MKGFVEVNTNSALVQLVSFFAENKVLPYTPITTNFAFLWLFLELLGDKIPNQNKKPGSAAAAGSFSPT